MTNETMLAMRSALMRAPTPASSATRSTDAVRTAGAGGGAPGASARGTGSASRPFEESMSRALRERSETRSAHETPPDRGSEIRDAGEGRGMNEGGSGRSETDDERTTVGTDSTRLASTRAAAETPVADAPTPSSIAWTGAVAAAGGEAPAHASVATPLPPDGELSTDAAVGDASARPTPSASPTGATAAAMRPAASAAVGAGIAPSSTTPDPDSAAPESDPPAVDARSTHADDDGPGATPADAVSSARGAESLPRSTGDFAAQLAHARNAFVAPNAQPTSGASGATDPASASPDLHGVDVPVSPADARFAGRFAAEVALLGSAGVERAEIQLQPRELGPVRVELSLSGESARIAFSAVQPETRQAIEQSLPILKDLLAERGLTLGQASVSDGRRDDRANDDTASASRADSTRGDPAASSDPASPADPRRAAPRRTLLDLYV